jgi:protein involved in sex pheromone biosynthesis
LTISLTSYNDKILTVSHDENQAKEIASAVPNSSTLGQIIYGVSTATISWFPGHSYLCRRGRFFKKDNLGVYGMRNHCRACSEETINAGFIGIGSPERSQGQTRYELRTSSKLTRKAAGLN